MSDTTIKVKADLTLTTVFLRPKSVKCSSLSVILHTAEKLVCYTSVDALIVLKHALKAIRF